MAEISTKPYMLRAIHEWCTDNGYTPYIAVFVDKQVRVPYEFVKDNEIVLNLSYTATHDLHIGNDMITFAARFGGVAHNLDIPVANVLAIYAQESGQGMAFPVDRDALESSTSKTPSLISLVVTEKPARPNDEPEPEPDPERPTPRRHHLRIIK
jgi:stringent starvation protein B